MIKRILKSGRKTARRLLGKGNTHQRFNEKGNERISQIYEGKDYLAAYSRHTDLRVEEDPKLAVGGKWEEIGKLQFNFLVEKGLSPNHKMLDIGCGTLRGGRHAIKHLNTGNYYGMDISPKAIAYAEELVQREGLSDKTPHLLVSENRNLKFEELSDIVFDYILAQSVFSHLKEEHIEECFVHVGDIMHDDSVFYFTYNNAEEKKQFGIKDFAYPFAFFESLAKKYGFQLQDCSKEYEHPRDQHMVELRKK